MGLERALAVFEAQRKSLVQRRAQARAKIEDPLLYWLLYEYIFRHFNVGPFRIFRYLTFRTAFASLTALFMALIIGPSVIRRLREFQIGQYIREEGPRSHQKKAGTPTMGGLLIVVSIVLPTLLWSDLSNNFVWLAVFSTLAFGAIGFADDYLKVVRKQNLGLNGRSKLLLQTLVAFVDRRGADSDAGRGRVLHPPDGAVLQAIPSGPGGKLRWSAILTCGPSRFCLSSSLSSSCSWARPTRST